MTNKHFENFFIVKTWNTNNKYVVATHDYKKIGEITVIDNQKVEFERYPNELFVWDTYVVGANDCCRIGNSQWFEITEDYHNLINFMRELLGMYEI